MIGVLLLCFADLQVENEKLKAKTTDWTNIASRHQHEAEESKKRAEEWRQKSNTERVKCNELEKNNADLQEAQAALASQLETEKKAAEEQKRYLLI